MFRCLTYFIVLSVVLICVSCGEEPLYSENDTNGLSGENVISERTNTVTVSDLPLPSGTQTSFSNGVVNFMLPAGYSMTGVTTGGQLVAGGVGVGEVSCDCTSNDGQCQPFKGGGKVGCATEAENPCTTCVMRTKGKIGPDFHQFERFFIKVPDDPSIPDELTFDDSGKITDMEKWEQMEWANSEIIDEKESHISQIYDYIDANHDPDEKRVLIAYSFSNKKALLKIPFSSIENDMLYTSETGVTNNAYCSGCDGACELETASLGRIKYCTGCSSGCTLHF